MTQTHSTTKKQSYTHLTEIERGQMAAYIQEDLSYREIGRRLGRNVSTISREIERGTVIQIDRFVGPIKSVFLISVRVFTRKIVYIAVPILRSWKRGVL